MISESVIDLVPTTIDTPELFFVYYNEWNGEILFVSKSKKENNDENIAFIETSNPLAKKILKGSINEREHIVAFVDDETLDIIKRDDKLRIRSSEKTLHQLTRKPFLDWDIRAKIYTGNNKLLLEINPSSISKLTKLTFKKELHVSVESDLTLYLTKQNQPDFFLEKIDVDAVELLDRGNLLFDISNIVQYININDLGILTRRCFKNYHVEFIDDSLNILQNSLIKNRSFVIDKALHGFPHAHITIESTGKTIIVKPTVTVGELEEVGLLEKKLKLHVVGSSIDEYHGSIHIDVDEMKKMFEFER